MDRLMVMPDRIVNVVPTLSVGRRPIEVRHRGSVAVLAYPSLATSGEAPAC